MSGQVDDRAVDRHGDPWPDDDGPTEAQHEHETGSRQRVISATKECRPEMRRRRARTLYRVVDGPDGSPALIHQGDGEACFIALTTGQLKALRETGIVTLTPAQTSDAYRQVIPPAGTRLPAGRYGPLVMTSPRGWRLGVIDEAGVDDLIAPAKPSTAGPDEKTTEGEKKSPEGLNSGSEGV